MRLLVVGLDAATLDPTSRSAARQLAYFEGYDVDIVVVAPGEKKEVALSPRVKVMRAGSPSKIGALLATAKLLRQLRLSAPYDAVTIQEPVACGTLAVFFGPHAPLHLQDHSAYFSRRPNTFSGRIVFLVAKYIARRAARIRTVSARGQRGLSSIGIPSERIDVVPISTDVSRFADVPPMATEHRALCIARLEQEKGVDVLLRAWPTVIERFPDARLRIVGDGSARRNLEAFAKQLETSSSVEFAGAHPDVHDDLAWSSLVVQPSRFEGWGLSVIEAAAAERPIVMTDVGCAGEVIRDGVSGTVVPVEDVAALAQGIVRTWSNHVAAERMAHAAREAVVTLPTPEETVQRIRASFEATKREVRLLVLAQAVDLDDPLFGFFHGWLEQAAKRFPHLLVAALRVGRHSLPKKVEVEPLRPSGSRSRLAVVLKLLSLSWKRRHDYDAVFIRGDAQYLALAGWLWKLFGKPSVFWYTHTSAKSMWFWLAVPWATKVVTAVPESNPLKRAIPIGHHIETSLFENIRHDTKSVPSFLILGRMSSVKRVELMVRTLSPYASDGRIQLTLAGKAPDAEYAKTVRAELPAQATWEDRDVAPSDVLSFYAKADVVVNATEASLDKVILEGAASGCVVFASTPGYLRGLPDDLHWLRFVDEKELAMAIDRYLALSPDERSRIGERLRQWVRQSHSMDAHLGRLAELFKSL